MDTTFLPSLPACLGDILQIHGLRRACHNNKKKKKENKVRLSNEHTPCHHYRSNVTQRRHAIVMLIPLPLFSSWSSSSVRMPRTLTLRNPLPRPRTCLFTPPFPLLSYPVIISYTPLSPLSLFLVFGLEPSSSIPRPSCVYLPLCF